jgi:hypothetical protein
MTCNLRHSSTRRGLFTLAAAGGLALGATSVSAGTAKAGASISSDPAARLEMFMMMRGALDDKLVIGCLTGRYYGIVDAQLKLLFGLVSATFSRYRPALGGGHAIERAGIYAKRTKEERRDSSKQ